jgi:hypothetical protein
MKITTTLAVSLIFTAHLFAADSKPKPPTYLTVEEALKEGPDINLQGEYATEKIGLQVIALGNGNFRAVIHKGGLPGAGWDKSEKVEIESKLDVDKIDFTQGDWKIALNSSDATLEGPAGKFALKKVERESPTMGATPPKAAVVLFDGSSCDAFTGGHFDDLNRHLLASGSKTQRADFQDYTLHLEFLLPFKPLGRGQDRGNSGVYNQDRYEVQVLDSFGLKGVSNECGGIYRKTDPTVNMCFPPLRWQTYDIDFEAARYDASATKIKNAVITVKHNGVLIHDKVEIDGPTGGGKKEDPTGGAIQLQGHGNPVYYRNIWILPK